MPPLAKFDVRPSVRQWMTAKDRKERIPIKATTQAWFNKTTLLERRTMHIDFVRSDSDSDLQL